MDKIADKLWELYAVEDDVLAFTDQKDRDITKSLIILLLIMQRETIGQRIPCQNEVKAKS